MVTKLGKANNCDTKDGCIRKTTSLVVWQCSWFTATVKKAKHARWHIPVQRKFIIKIKINQKEQRQAKCKLTTE